MHIDQAPYRALYDAILCYEGSGLHEDVVRPWMRGQDAERRWLEAFSRRSGSPIPHATVEELWRLYALSRIVELLQLSFAPPGRNVGEWGLMPVAEPEYAELMEFLGLRRVNADLSNGWGSNSAWRTPFRRDYFVDGAFHHNVDAKRDTESVDDDLDMAERLELPRFRCFVKCAKPHHDRFPYHESWVERP